MYLLCGLFFLVIYEASANNVVTGVHPLCRQSPSRGACFSGAKRRAQYWWFYSALTERCQPFLYSGCGGNSNRFRSKADCQFVCGISLIFSGEQPQVVFDSADKDLPSAVTTAKSIDIEVNCEKPTESDKLTVTEANAKRVIRRYFWDSNRFMCLSYFPRDGVTKGSATLGKCLDTCRPMDGPTCFAAGVSTPVRGDGHECGDDSCDDGYTCMHGAFSVSCCPKAAEAERNCPSGQKPFEIMEKDQQYGTPLMATSCNDLDCPEQHTCIEGSYVAKCCPGVKKNPITAPQADSAPVDGDDRSETFPSFKMRARLCLLPIDAGRHCNNAGVQIKYAFQRKASNGKELNRCVKFSYLGCAGNANRFDAEKICRDKCRAIRRFKNRLLPVAN